MLWLGCFVAFCEVWVSWWCSASIADAHSCLIAPVSQTSVSETGNPDRPAQLTPEELIKQHTAHMDYLVVMYKRTDRRFRLTHLLGAVKREYGKLRYVP